jgi:hypothetical protein
MCAIKARILPYSHESYGKLNDVSKNTCVPEDDVPIAEPVDSEFRSSLPPW